MAEMGEMEMPSPDNTLPMMAGWGQFGPIEMRGMMSVMKVREELAPNDYSDAGWFKHPEGTVAYEVENGVAGEAVRQPGAKPATESAIEMKAVKPGTGGAHQGH
jgi:hypothetical protein